MKPKLFTCCLFFFVHSIVFAQNKKTIDINTGRSILTVSFYPEKKVSITTAGWYTSSQKPFSEAGEEGWHEPGGKRKKMNVDFSASFQFNNWLQSDVGFNYAKEGLLGVLYHDDYISLESSVAITGGLSAFLKKGLNISLRYGILGDYPFYQQVHTKRIERIIKDIQIGYSLNNFELAISAENIFIGNTKDSFAPSYGLKEYETVTVASTKAIANDAPRFLKTSLLISF